MDKLVVFEENAPKFSEWLKTRGGLAVWRSVDLSDPGASCTTPALTEGKPTTKPHWKYANEPERIITDANEVQVQRMAEVKRFHVAVKRGSGFMNLVLTDASDARVHRELDKAGEGSSVRVLHISSITGITRTALSSSRIKSSLFLSGKQNKSTLNRLTLTQTKLEVVHA